MLIFDDDNEFDLIDIQEEQKLEQIQSEEDHDDLLYYDGDTITPPQKSSVETGIQEYDLDFIDDISTPSNDFEDTISDDDLLALDDDSEILNEHIINQSDNLLSDNDSFIRPQGVQDGTDDITIIDDDEDDKPFISSVSPAESVVQDTSQDDDLLILDDDEDDKPFISSVSPAESVVQDTSDDLLILDDENDDKPFVQEASGDDDLLAIDEEESFIRPASIKDDEQSFVRPASMQENFVRPAGATEYSQDDNDEVKIIDEDSDYTEPIPNPNISLDNNSNNEIVIDEESGYEPEIAVKAPSQLDIVLNSMGQKTPVKEIKYDENGFEIIDENPKESVKNESESELISPMTVQENIDDEKFSEPEKTLQEPAQTPQTQVETPKKVFREFKDAITAREEAKEAGKLNSISIPADEPLINKTTASDSDDEEYEEDEEDEEDENFETEDNEYVDDVGDEESDEDDNSKKKSLVIKAAIAATVIFVLVGAGFAAKTFFFKDKNVQTQQAVESESDIIGGEEEPGALAEGEGIIVPGENDTTIPASSATPVVSASEEEGGLVIPASGDNEKIAQTMPPQDVQKTKQEIQTPALAEAPKAVSEPKTPVQPQNAVVQIHKVSWGVNATLA